MGLSENNEGKKFLQSFSPVTQNHLPEHFTIATDKEVNKAVDKASIAFVVYKAKTAEERAVFLELIAEEIVALGDELIQRAMLKTGLPEVYRSCLVPANDSLFNNIYCLCNNIAC